MLAASKMTLGPSGRDFLAKAPQHIQTQMFRWGNTVLGNVKNALHGEVVLPSIKTQSLHAQTGGYFQAKG